MIWAFGAGLTSTLTVSKFVPPINSLQDITEE